MKRRKWVILFIASVLLISLVGCSDDSTKKQIETTNENNTVKEKKDIDLSMSTFKEIDFSNATKIVMGDTVKVTGDGATAEGNIVKISKEGNYTLSGSTTNGQVVIEADKAKVNLELDNVTITNKTGPAILTIDDKETNIVLKEGTTNTLTDGGKDEEHEAAIYCDNDLSISGEGTLVVTGNYLEGIESNDVLTIYSGNIYIKAVDDAINAGDALIINGGNIYAECEGDGLDSNGDLAINGGNIVVFAGNNANGPIDSGDGYTFVMNGGTIVAGGGNMAISASEDSEQAGVWVFANTPKDSVFSITAEDGTEILSFKALKASSAIYVSSPELESNKTYTLLTGGKISSEAVNGIYPKGAVTNGTAQGTFETTSKTVSIGQSSGMGGGPGGPGRK